MNPGPPTTIEFYRLALRRGLSSPDHTSLPTDGAVPRPLRARLVGVVFGSVYTLHLDTRALGRSSFYTETRLDKPFCRQLKNAAAEDDIEIMSKLS